MQTMPEILFEDNHLIIVNKRCGDIIQGDKTGDTPLGEIIKEYLKEKYQKPGNVFLGVTHRLDRPTSGVVVFARTSKALSRMNELFRQGEKVQKTYWAVVDNKPFQQEDTLSHWMVRRPEKNKSFAYRDERSGAKKASLSYRYLGASDRFHLLEIDLHTGRHHQIRAQLSAVGLHIKGDLKYGFSRSNSDAGIHLHARRIKFVHPVSKTEMVVEARPPKDPVWDYFVNRLR